MRPASATSPRQTPLAGDQPGPPAVLNVYDPANLPDLRRLEVVQNLRASLRDALPPAGQVSAENARNRQLSKGFMAIGAGCTAITLRALYRMIDAPPAEAAFQQVVAFGAATASSVSFLVAFSLDQKASRGEATDAVLREFAGNDHEGEDDLADADRRLAMMRTRGVRLRTDFPSDQ